MLEVYYAWFFALENPKGCENISRVEHVVVPHCGIQCIAMVTAFPHPGRVLLNVSTLNTGGWSWWLMTFVLDFASFKTFEKYHGVGSYYTVIQRWPVSPLNIWLLVSVAIFGFGDHQKCPKKCPEVKQRVVQWWPVCPPLGDVVQSVPKKCPEVFF